MMNKSIETLKPKSYHNIYKETFNITEYSQHMLS
jgi:hypothetical protein